MKNKTKAIIAVIVVALVALGYCFINTTAKMEAAFAKIGAIAVAAFIIIAAIVAIVLINKAKKAKESRDTKTK
ncbi:MAG: hypothetical protein Q4F55_02310 [Bacillota bacterium]|nr:hypothetical protein [Bacillota bacterium]